MPGLRPLSLVVLLGAAVAAQAIVPPDELPTPAVGALGSHLAAAGSGPHLWRDTRPINEDGTVTAYVEIARGDRRKWEFDMASNARVVDRVIPEDVGGFPVNYGFVPQTVAYDGDPFDALVLGPPLPAGEIVRGVPVGLLLMRDEKGHDPKIVLSLPAGGATPRERLTDERRREIAAFFVRYKDHDPAALASVSGWGSAAEGLAYVEVTTAFFHRCRHITGPCRLQH